MSDTAENSLLPGFTPLPPKPAALPPEARGSVGGKATFYGFGTKSEENIAGSKSYFDEYPNDKLLELSDALDPSWSSEDIARIKAIAERAVAIGEYRSANLWISNLQKPRSPYTQVDALERMIGSLERAVRAKAKSLDPVEAIQYSDLSEISALSAGAAFPDIILPAPVASAILRRINEIHQAIAKAGFRSPHEINAANAPQDILQLTSELSHLQGATVRASNQCGYLKTVSRKGQTPHEPMTMKRRLLLVDAAFAQVGAILKREPWTAETSGLVTSDVQEAWRTREIEEPLPEFFARTLFEWHEKTSPDPRTLDDAELVKKIQQHPDLDYVDLLRKEQRRRLEARLSAEEAY